jgi:putative Mn2+ efflux pump MntP
MKAWLKDKIPIIVSTSVTVVAALTLNYLYERFDTNEVHTVHLLRTYLTFFSYPFIPAMIGGFIFAILSSFFSRNGLIINICLLTLYFLFTLRNLNPSEKFVIIFIVFLPLMYIGFLVGNYIGRKIKAKNHLK